MKTITTLLSIFTLAFGTSALAQEPSVGNFDQKFLQNSANCNRNEAALAKLAESKAVNPQVKSFAAMMAKDHAAMNEKITLLAAKKNVELTVDPEKVNKDVANLTKKEGKEFDKDYMKLMVSNHKDLIESLEKALKSEDPEVTKMAHDALPNIKAHLAQAEKIEDAIDA